MFEHDTLEAATNRIVITDFDYETMKELLKYVYCEQVENISESAFNLLPAADKVSFIHHFVCKQK